MNLHELIFDVSLYQKIKISENRELFDSILKSGADVEGYNPFRNVESTFTIIKGLGNFHDYNPFGVRDYSVPEVHFSYYWEDLVNESTNSILVL